MKKNLIYKIIIFVSIILVITAAVANADKKATATATATVKIIGGDLSISATDIKFNTIDLNTGQNSATAENTITVEDPTGTRAGWNVTARAENFVSEDGEKELSLGKINFIIKNVSSNRIMIISGNKAPAGVGNPVQLDQTDKKILIAEKGSGMGKFQINPEYSLRIPGDSPTGNFSSKVTFTLFQGP